MPVFFPHSGRACDSQLIRVVAFGSIDMLFSSFAGEPLSETSDRAERVTRVILQVERKQTRLRYRLQRQVKPSR